MMTPPTSKQTLPAGSAPAVAGCAQVVPDDRRADGQRSEVRCSSAECTHPAYPAKAPTSEQLGCDATAPPGNTTSAAWWAANLLWHTFWQAWRYLREVSGDDAYERYLVHLACAHPGQPPMTRGEHFKLRQEQKWSRLSRCC